MPRLSTVDRLPAEVREKIGHLRAAGHTIDEIMAALGELDDARISRSALGRHIKGMEKVGQQMRRSREIAQALTRNLGDEPASRLSQLNHELIQTQVLQICMAAEDGEGADQASVLALAKALDHLARASKSNVDYVRKVEEAAAEKARRQAASVVDEQVRQKGLSAELAATIKTAIFGVRPSA